MSPRHGSRSPTLPTRPRPARARRLRAASCRANAPFPWTIARFSVTRRGATETRSGRAPRDRDHRAAVFDSRRRTSGGDARWSRYGRLPIRFGDVEIEHGADHARHEPVDVECARVRVESSRAGVRHEPRVTMVILGPHSTPGGEHSIRTTSCLGMAVLMFNLKSSRSNMGRAIPTYEPGHVECGRVQVESSRAQVRHEPRVTLVTLDPHSIPGGEHSV
jgi:phage baseplate assembly protein W